VASIFKKDKHRKNSPWYIDYFDEHGQRQRVKGCPDRTVTEQIARKLESDVELRRRGIIDPRADRRAAAERKPLVDHLADFHGALLAKGNTAKHADLHVSRALRVAALAGIDRLSDLSPSRVQGALAALRGEGRSLATCNHHRAAIRGFSRWLWKDGRLHDDPLAGVTGYNAQEDRRHDRRTLGVDDLRRLIDAAYNGPRYRLMTGPARALCYRLAVATGLRYSEIKSLTPEAFDGDTVTIQAAYAKNGQTATLPLPPDVASD
jgi:integrase